MVFNKLSEIILHHENKLFSNFPFNFLVNTKFNNILITIQLMLRTVKCVVYRMNFNYNNKNRLFTEQNRNRPSYCYKIVMNIKWKCLAL